MAKNKTHKRRIKKTRKTRKQGGESSPKTKQALNEINHLLESTDIMELRSHIYLLNHEIRNIQTSSEYDIQFKKLLETVVHLLEERVRILEPQQRQRQ